MRTGRGGGYVIQEAIAKRLLISYTKFLKVH